MIGIVVAAHGQLATQLLATAELIIGAVPNALACNLSHGLSVQAIEEELHRAVSAVEQGDGVLVLSDLIGGTPCTRSVALCQKARIEVLTGVNLPMLIKANSLRGGGERPLREVASALTSAARGSIRWATETLPAELGVASNG